MMKSEYLWTSDVMWSVCGVSGSSMSDCQDWKSDPGRAAPRFFPPEVVVQVKAIACELPATRGVPLSRLSCADIVREAQRSGIVATLKRQDRLAVAP